MIISDHLAYINRFQQLSPRSVSLAREDLIDTREANKRQSSQEMFFCLQYTLKKAIKDSSYQAFLSVVFLFM